MVADGTPVTQQPHAAAPVREMQATERSATTPLVRQRVADRGLRRRRGHAGGCTGKGAHALKLLQRWARFLHCVADTMGTKKISIFVFVRGHTHTHGSAAAPPRVAPFARRVPERSSHVPRLGSRMPCVLALRIRIHFEDSARRVSRTAQCRTGSPDRSRTGRCSHQRNAHRPHPTRGSGAAGALQRDAAREVRGAQRPQIPSHRAVPPLRQRRSDMGGEANAKCRRSCDDLLLVSHLQSALGGAVKKKWTMT